MLSIIARSPLSIRAPHQLHRLSNYANLLTWTLLPEKKYLNLTENSILLIESSATNYLHLFQLCLLGNNIQFLKPINQCKFVNQLMQYWSMNKARPFGFDQGYLNIVHLHNLFFQQRPRSASKFMEFAKEKREALIRLSVGESLIKVECRAALNRIYQSYSGSDKTEIVNELRHGLAERGEFWRTSKEFNRKYGLESEQRCYSVDKKWEAKPIKSWRGRYCCQQYSKDLNNELAELAYREDKLLTLLRKGDLTQRDDRVELKKRICKEVVARREVYQIMGRSAAEFEAGLIRSDLEDDFYLPRDQAYAAKRAKVRELQRALNTEKANLFNIRKSLESEFKESQLSKTNYLHH